MVTRSTQNWEQHKKDVFTIIAKKYGVKRADKFLTFYEERYNPFGRSFLSWKIAVCLYNDWNYINKNGTKVYACVGDGGTGKTTFMKNAFYFLDSTMTLKRANVDVEDFIKQVYELSPEKIEDVKEPRAVFMDEPDTTLHAGSKEGKVLRSILGKARQHKLAIGICATDMTDIPNYFWKKVSGIFFMPYKGKVWFIRNRPKKKSYPIQRIKQDYATKGYQVFFEVKKFTKVLQSDTIAATPFSANEELHYLDDKYADYRKDIKRFLGMKSGEIDSKRDIAIINLYREGLMHPEKKLTQVQIGKMFGLTPERINQIVKSVLTK